MTVARLGRQNLRCQLVATVMETLDVDPSEHEPYSPSWPIIKGRVPVSDDVLIDAWPCNHLAFAYGDWIAALAELARRMDIEYSIAGAAGSQGRPDPDLAAFVVLTADRRYNYAYPGTERV